MCIGDRAPRPAPDTTHDGRRLLIYSAAARRPPTPDSPAHLHTVRHCNAGNPRAGSVRIAATIRPARQAPTAPHTAPHTGTRLLRASVAHFDVLYFNLRVAGVPLFKADRGAPPVMGVLPIYRSTLQVWSSFAGRSTVLPQ